MPQLSPFRHLIAPAIAGVLMMSTTVAVAQSAQQRSEERRNKRGGDSATAKQENKYPNATRKEPEAKPSSRMQPKLQRLFKAYDEQDAAKVEPIAQEIIADEKANAYDRAISARIAGAVLINEDDAKAATYLKQALEFDGLNNNDHFETMLITAQLAMQEDKYAEALPIIERYFNESQSTSANDLALKANVYYRLDRPADAVPILKSIVEGTPEPKSEWVQMLMAAYADTDQNAEATALAEQLASKSPSDRQSQINLAAMYLQSDQDAKAIEVYERLRAAGQLTEDRDYRNLSALYQGQDGKEREAIAVLNEGLEKGVLKPDYQTYVALAQAYYFSEQIEPSIENYRKAAPLAENGEAYLNLAKVLANEDRIAEAKQAAQQALDKGIKNPKEARDILARPGK